jgi:hypothetical protein
VGGRTEGGGEDNSDRQPHFLTILSDYKNVSFSSSSSSCSFR